MQGLNNHLVKPGPACPLCRPCLLFYSYLCGTRNQFGLQQARPWDSQVGKVARQELNRTEQPAIHMDQVDRLSINGVPLESKTLAQAREELLREIRIPAAIQVSLYVFTVCYSSIFLPQPAQPETESLLRWFIHLYYVLSGGYCWPLSGIQLGFCWQRCAQGRNMVWVKGLIRCETKCCCELFLHDFGGEDSTLFSWMLHREDTGVI